MEAPCTQRKKKSSPGSKEPQLALSASFNVKEVTHLHKARNVCDSQQKHLFQVTFNLSMVLQIWVNKEEEDTSDFPLFFIIVAKENVSLRCPSPHAWRNRSSVNSCPLCSNKAP